MGFVTQTDGADYFRNARDTGFRLNRNTQRFRRFVTRIAPSGTVPLLSPNLFHERGTTDQIARLIRNTLCLNETELPLILRRGEIGGEFFQFGDRIGS